MKLMMLFGNDVIDIIKIRKTKLTPSYLQNLKETLIERNEENLNVASDEPLFALKQAASNTNRASEYELI